MKTIIPLAVILLYLIGLFIRDSNLEPRKDIWMAIGRVLMNLALLIVALFFVFTLIGGILQV